MSHYTDMGHFDGRGRPPVNFDSFLDQLFEDMDTKTICVVQHPVRWRSRRFKSQVKSGIIFKGLDWCTNSKEKKDAEFFLDVFADLLIDTLGTKEYSDPEVVEMLENLFARGFSPYSRDCGNSTLLQGAIFGLYPKLFDMLLAMPETDVNAIDFDGKTALSDLTSYILADDPRFEYGTVGVEMLRKLLADDRLDTSILRPKNPTGNWKKTDYPKMTILSDVAGNRAGSIKVFRALLESRKFDINEMNPDGSSVLRHAVNRCIQHDHMRIKKTDLEDRFNENYERRFEWWYISQFRSPLMEDSPPPKPEGFWGDQDDWDFQNKRQYPDSIETRVCNRQVVKVTTDDGVTIEGVSTRKGLFQHPFFKALRKDTMLTLHLDSRGLEFVHLILSQPDLDIGAQMNGVYEACITTVDPAFAPVGKAILKIIAEKLLARVTCKVVSCCFLVLRSSFPVCLIVLMDHFFVRLSGL